MARVFVSHASKDTPSAVDVHDRLVEAGHEVFLDRDLGDGIAVGEEWQRRLHERLRWADAVVCLVSAAYVSSTWCAMELGIAQSRGSVILPVQTADGLEHPALICRAVGERQVVAGSSRAVDQDDGRAGLVDAAPNATRRRSGGRPGEGDGRGGAHAR
jgi:hypothetical protein